MPVYFWFLYIPYTDQPCVYISKLPSISRFFFNAVISRSIFFVSAIKVGYVNAYEVLKVGGEERFCEWDIEPGAHYQEVPKWLLPGAAYSSYKRRNGQTGSGNR